MLLYYAVSWQIRLRCTCGHIALCSWLVKCLDHMVACRPICFLLMTLGILAKPTYTAQVRATHHTAMAAASSGVAALLLEGGGTAHYKFKTPLKVDDTSNCM